MSGKLLRLFLAISLLMVIGLTSDSLGEEEMYRFSKDCSDPDLVPSENIFCKKNDFLVTCAEDEVVVATVCLGMSPHEGVCNETSSGCHESYTTMNMHDHRYVQAIEDCLLKRHQCDLRNLSGDILGSPSDCEYEACLIIYACYDYITTFNFRCLPEQHVFDICSENETTMATNMSSTGYIHSPDFPKRDFLDKTCTKTIMAETTSQFDIFMQYQHFSHSDSDHQVQISAVLQDGSIIPEKSWTGIVNHENHTLYAKGIRIEYKKKGNQEGFVLSYRVSELPETSTLSEPVTSQTTEDATPLISRSSTMTSYPAHILLCVCFSRYAIT